MAVLRMALSSRYAFAVLVALIPESRRRPAAPLARRQRRAPRWDARPAHAGPYANTHIDQSGSSVTRAGAGHSRLPRA